MKTHIKNNKDTLKYNFYLTFYNLYCLGKLYIPDKINQMFVKIFFKCLKKIHVFVRKIILFEKRINSHMFKKKL